VFDGKASEKAMINYYNRTVEPLVTAFAEEMRRKFLTQTARTQRQSIMGFRDILRLIPANEMADMADAFTRNEILTPNEIRSILGIKPSKDPGADDIRNKNMPIDKQPNSYIKKRKPVEEEEEGEEKEQTRLLYDIE
jgi:phage portal protein BeeE